MIPSGVEEVIAGDSNDLWLWWPIKAYMESFTIIRWSRNELYLNYHRDFILNIPTAWVIINQCYKGAFSDFSWWDSFMWEKLTILVGSDHCISNPGGPAFNKTCHNNLIPDSYRYPSSTFLLREDFKIPSDSKHVLTRHVAVLISGMIYFITLLIRVYGSLKEFLFGFCSVSNRIYQTQRPFTVSKRNYSEQVIKTLLWSLKI